MRWPTSILAGPPKCGTSSLFGWLGDHPRVAVPSIKETYFFTDRDSPFLRPEANIHLHGVDGYRRFLGPEKPDAVHLLDGSTHTIFQPGVIPLVADLDPRPHLIFVVRKPSQRMLSSFRFARHNLATIDGDLSFARFVELVRAGRHDELRPYFRLERAFYVLCRDLDYSRYVEHLEPWQRHFDADHLHLLVFEEMCADPHRVVSDLASRLGLDPAFYDDYGFAPANPTVRVRSSKIHRMVRRLAPAIPKNRLTRLAYRLYMASQQRGRPTTSSEDAQALAELDEYFEPWNQRLEQAFGIDSRAWR